MLCRVASNFCRDLETLGKGPISFSHWGLSLAERIILPSGRHLPAPLRNGLHFSLPLFAQFSTCLFLFTQSDMARQAYKRGLSKNSTDSQPPYGALLDNYMNFWNSISLRAAGLLGTFWLYRHLKSPVDSFFAQPGNQKFQKFWKVSSILADSGVGLILLAELLPVKSPPKNHPTENSNKKNITDLLHYIQKATIILKRIASIMGHSYIRIGNSSVAIGDQREPPESFEKDQNSIKKYFEELFNWSPYKETWQQVDPNSYHRFLDNLFRFRESKTGSTILHLFAEQGSRTNVVELFKLLEIDSGESQSNRNSAKLSPEIEAFLDNRNKEGLNALEMAVRSIRYPHSKDWTRLGVIHFLMKWVSYKPMNMLKELLELGLPEDRFNQTRYIRLINSLFFNLKKTHPPSTKEIEDLESLLRGLKFKTENRNLLLEEFQLRFPTEQGNRAQPHAV